MLNKNYLKSIKQDPQLSKGRPKVEKMCKWTFKKKSDVAMHIGSVQARECFRPDISEMQKQDSKGKTGCEEGKLKRSVNCRNRKYNIFLAN